VASGLTAEEAADAEFLADAGRAAGAPRVEAVSASAQEVRLAVVDAATAQITERKETLVRPGAAALAREQIAALGPKAPPPALSLVEQPRAPEPPAPESRRWYQCWWLWAAVGPAAVAAGAVTVATIGNGSNRPGGERRYDLAFRSARRRAAGGLAGRPVRSRVRRRRHSRGGTVLCHRPAPEPARGRPDPDGQGSVPRSAGGRDRPQGEGLSRRELRPRRQAGHVRRRRRHPAPRPGITIALACDDGSDTAAFRAYLAR
jgi:hypothetical protein